MDDANIVQGIPAPWVKLLRHQRVLLSTLCTLPMLHTHTAAHLVGLHKLPVSLDNVMEPVCRAKQAQTAWT